MWSTFRNQQSVSQTEHQNSANCMVRMTRAFHFQQENVLTLMTAFQRLNTAEEYDDIHEVLASSMCVCNFSTQDLNAISYFIRMS